MTNQEFNALRDAILRKKAALEKLQAKYREQTGRDYVEIQWFPEKERRNDRNRNSEI